jgi:hypothetical protein
MEERERRRRILELVARVATFAPGSLSGDQRSQAVADATTLSGWDVQSLGLVFAAFHIEIHRVVEGLLKGTPALPLIGHVAHGWDAAGPTITQRDGRLQAGWSRVSAMPLLGEFNYYVWIASVRKQRCPFGRCPMCEVVFVQPDRGRLRRYCSERCKAKGIPSAAKRTEYVKQRRQRRRKEDIDTTRRVLRAWMKAEHYARLQKEFPRKSRRELLYLMKRARERGKEK